MPNQKARIESVVITYCGRNRKERRSVSVDLDAVSAIRWRPIGTPVTPAPSLPAPKGVPHKDPKGLGACNKTHDSTAQAAATSESSDGQLKVTAMQASPSQSEIADFCWYDGNQWICPNDVDQ